MTETKIEKGATKGSAALQLSATKVANRMPVKIAVGDAELELLSGPMGTEIKRYAARWHRGAYTADADASVEVRRTDRTESELSVRLERPKGAQAFLWPRTSLRRLEDLLAQALAYEIETRTVEEGTSFFRRTTPELVRSRAS